MYIGYLNIVIIYYSTVWHDVLYPLYIVKGKQSKL